MVIRIFKIPGDTAAEQALSDVYMSLHENCMVDVFRVVHVLGVEACNSIPLNVGGVAARVVEAR